jgi:AraC-like DNA-binding protein
MLAHSCEESTKAVSLRYHRRSLMKPHMSNPLPPSASSTLRASLAQNIMRHAADGALFKPAAIPGLMLMRNDLPYANGCGLYEPCVALIVQGAKRVMLGEEPLVYGPDRYLIASVDLPVSATLLEASPDRPYLALALSLDWREIASLMLDEPKPAAVPPPVRNSRAMTTGLVSEPLLDAFHRLVLLLDQPEHIPALAPMIKREIQYRLLVSETGSRLREMATINSQSHQIARAIAHLKERFDQPLRIEDLAREASMSVSTYHHHFKAMTAMSPLQYQKQLRLSEARRLMLSENLEASSAAFRVGYESPSQFSREYSRLFGAPPSKDIPGLRGKLASTA